MPLTTQNSNRFKFRSPTVDDKSFRDAFGSCIPAGLNRQELARQTVRLQRKCETKLYDLCAGKNVFLLVDCGTLSRRNLLNMSVAWGGSAFFLKSVRLATMTAPILEREIEKAITELAMKRVFVFCVVSDNARNFLLATGRFEKQAHLAFEDEPEEGSRSDEDEGDEMHDEDEDQDERVVEMLEQVMESLSTKGIFSVRCASHSMQLALRDFGVGIAAVKSAVENIKALLSKYASTAGRAAKFLEAQSACGREQPRLLKRIGATRWNSFLDAWKTALDLKPIILAIEAGKDETVSPGDWVSFEKAILVCEPVAVATDLLQIDRARKSSATMGQSRFVSISFGQDHRSQKELFVRLVVMSYDSPPTS